LSVNVVLEQSVVRSLRDPCEVSRLSPPDCVPRRGRVVPDLVVLGLCIALSVCVGRDIDSSCSLVRLSVRNPVEGIRCRIKSLGLFKGTVPLLRHLLSRISSLGLFKGTVPLLRLY
jgi:hypothetical protein